MIKTILKKILIYGSIGLILIIIGLFVYAGSNPEDFPKYSTLSPQKNGTKALYLLTQKMGYDAKRYKWPAKFLPDDTTMIVVRPEQIFLTMEQEMTNLIEWLKKGNTFILIDDNFEIYELDEFIKLGPLKNNTLRSGKVYSVGKGKLIVIEESEKYTNEGLKSIDSGVIFINILDEIGNKNILFNEYYHGFEENPSVWDLLEQAGRLIVIQIALFIIVFIYIKSRRFGKPITVLEIVKRKENENMFALSNIYLKTKANSVALETCFNNFKQELSRFLGFSYVPDDSYLLTEALKNRRLREAKIAEVFSSCDAYISNEKKNMKQMVKLVEKLEAIRKEIK